MTLKNILQRQCDLLLQYLTKIWIFTEKRQKLVTKLILCSFSIYLCYVCSYGNFKFIIYKSDYKNYIEFII